MREKSRWPISCTSASTSEDKWNESYPSETNVIGLKRSENSTEVRMRLALSKRMFLKLKKMTRIHGNFLKKIRRCFCSLCKIC